MVTELTVLRGRSQCTHTDYDGSEFAYQFSGNSTVTVYKAIPPALSAMILPAADKTGQTDPKIVTARVGEEIPEKPPSKMAMSFH